MPTNLCLRHEFCHDSAMPGDVFCARHRRDEDLELARQAEETDLEAQRLEYDIYAGHPDPDDW